LRYGFHRFVSPFPDPGTVDAVPFVFLGDLRISVQHWPTTSRFHLPLRWELRDDDAHLSVRTDDGNEVFDVLVSDAWSCDLLESQVNH
jgi:hypothetical protein